MLSFLRSWFSRRHPATAATLTPTVLIDGQSLTPMQTLVLCVAARNLRARLDDPAYLRDRGRVGPVYRAEIAGLCELLTPRPEAPAAAPPRPIATT